MFPRKPQPALLGMAANMQLARQELFNPRQFIQLEQQIEHAKAMEQFTMDSAYVTIDLSARWKTAPVQPAPPPKQSKPRKAAKKVCPGCGKLFQNLGMHSYACKPPRQLQAGDICEYGCGAPALYVTVAGKTSCRAKATGCPGVSAKRLRRRKT